MQSKNLKVSAFESAHTMAILLTLFEEGRMVKGVLGGMITRNNHALLARIEELQTMGLLIETKEDKRPFRKFIELTPQGREVAVKLAEIEDLLEE